MADRKSVFNWQLLIGFILVVTGGLFLVDQFLDLNLMRNYWPLLVVLLGLTLFIGMILAGRRGAGLAIPGAVITMAGLILFIHNIYQLWITWTYAWGLMISAVGIGMLIMNIYLKRIRLRKAAGWVIGIGLILFVIFGIFFEIVLDLAGANINSGVFLGGGLVLLGLFVVFSRLIFSDGRKKTRIEEIETPSVEKFVKKEVVEETAPEVVTPDLESLEETITTVDEALGFSKIDFKGAGDVFIEMAENDSLNIEGDQELVERVKTEVRDGVLLITFPSDEMGWKGLMGIGEESRLRYFITVKALDQINLDGAGSIHSDKLEGENLKIHHAGLGKILFKELQYQNLDVELTGLGEIEIEGEVQAQTVHISGAGAYKADRLKSQEADVNLTGAGSSQVWVEKKLIASLTGAGSIKYKGTPILEESKTGLGNIGPITQ